MANIGLNSAGTPNNAGTRAAQGQQTGDDDLHTSGNPCSGGISNAPELAGDTTAGYASMTTPAGTYGNNPADPTNPYSGGAGVYSQGDLARAQELADAISAGDVYSGRAGTGGGNPPTSAQYWNDEGFSSGGTGRS